MEIQNDGFKKYAHEALRKARKGEKIDLGLLLRQAEEMRAKESQEEALKPKAEKKGDIGEKVSAGAVEKEIAGLERVIKTSLSGQLPEAAKQYLFEARQELIRIGYQSESVKNAMLKEMF